MRYLLLAAALALTGCAADGGFVGSPSKVGGVITSPFVDIVGMPNAMPSDMQVITSHVRADGSREDTRSVYIIKPDGTVIVTGPWVEYMAKARLCLIAPNAIECGGGAVLE